MMHLKFKKIWLVEGMSDEQNHLHLLVQVLFLNPRKVPRKEQF